MPLTALVAPMPGWAHEAGAVFVLMSNPIAQTPSRALLCELFNLTATEAAVAAALAEGLAPQEAARRLRIGIGTLRSHLKQVLAKTGTHRQAQLVALLLRSVAMFDGRPFY